MRKEAEAWLTLSAEDLQAAEVLFGQKVYRMACYHAQQSVEKIFKALLTNHEIDFPRTHNILDLHNAVKKLGYQPIISDEDAIFLNSIYRARYPSQAGLLPFGEPLDRDAVQSLQIAKKVTGWVKTIIGKMTA